MGRIQKVDPADWIKVPGQVAHCPMCGRRLFVAIDEWDDGTGKVTEWGFTVECESEEEPDMWHDYKVGNGWLKVTQKVYKWLCRHVRVREGNE